jgi:putative phosphoribosyl transferase
VDAPLDVFVVRQLGVPCNPEPAMGAIAFGGVQVMNDDVVRTSGVSHKEIERVLEQERSKLQERKETHRGARPGVALEGKTVLLVDDGLATGATMRAAVRALRERDPVKLVMAVPTAPPGTCSEFEDMVDAVLCLSTPARFRGVGGAYRDFGQTTNEQVREMLERAQ